MTFNLEILGWVGNNTGHPHLKYWGDISPPPHPPGIDTHDIQVLFENRRKLHLRTLEGRCTRSSKLQYLELKSCAAEGS